MSDIVVEDMRVNRCCILLPFPGNVLVINGSKWELPARLARLFVASPRLASVQLRPDLVRTKKYQPAACM